MCVALHLIVALCFEKERDRKRANKPNRQIIQSSQTGQAMQTSQTSQPYKLTKAWKYLHGCPNGFLMLTYCASVDGA